jgi:hypothetical protein
MSVRFCSQRGHLTQGGSQHRWLLVYLPRKSIERKGSAVRKAREESVSAGVFRYDVQL